MKQCLRKALLLTFCVLVLTSTAFADMGPKPQLTVKVLNPPTEPYYLDLLVAGSGGTYYDNFSLLAPPPDAAMVATMRQTTPGDCHLALLDGTYAPLWGSLTGKPQPDGTMHHTFSYFGVPDDFSILVMTQSGVETEFHSTLLHRTALQSSVTIDYATGSIAAAPVWLAYVLQFFSTFLPTLLLEGLLLLAFRFSWRENRKVFLLTNLVTQLLLSAVCGVSAITQGVSFFYYLFFLPLEAVILAVEAVVYRKFLTGQSRRRAVAYAVCANLCSAAVGLALAAPVWRWLVGHLL